MPHIKLSINELDCAVINRITTIPYQTLLQWKRSTTGQRKTMYYFMANMEERDLHMSWDEADSFAMINVDDNEEIMSLKRLSCLTGIHIQTLYAWRRRDLNYRRTLLYFLLTQPEDVLKKRWNIKNK